MLERHYGTATASRRPPDRISSSRRRIPTTSNRASRTAQTSTRAVHGSALLGRGDRVVLASTCMCPYVDAAEVDGVGHAQERVRRRRRGRELRGDWLRRARDRVLLASGLSAHARPCARELDDGPRRPAPRERRRRRPSSPAHVEFQEGGSARPSASSEPPCRSWSSPPLRSRRLPRATRRCCPSSRMASPSRRRRRRARGVEARAVRERVVRAQLEEHAREPHLARAGGVRAG